MSERVAVAIETASIKLDQFLKWAGVVQTGGEAKMLIQQGSVQVNGDLESRRGRTLSLGDVVSVASKEYVVTHDED